MTYYLSPATHYTLGDQSWIRHNTVLHSTDSWYHICNHAPGLPTILILSLDPIDQYQCNMLLISQSDSCTSDFLKLHSNIENHFLSYIQLLWVYDGTKCSVSIFVPYYC